MCVCLSLALQHITYYYYFSLFTLPILPTPRSCLAAVSYTGKMTGTLWTRLPTLVKFASLTYSPSRDPSRTATIRSGQLAPVRELMRRFDFGFTETTLWKKAVISFERRNFLQFN
jgi:hypothetical protein